MNSFANFENLTPYQQIQKEDELIKRLKENTNPNSRDAAIEDFSNFLTVRLVESATHNPPGSNKPNPWGIFNHVRTRFGNMRNLLAMKGKDYYLNQHEVDTVIRNVIYGIKVKYKQLYEENKELFEEALGDYLKV
ncbi:MAG: hypothetical protein ABIM99_06395 [Candidatus Dojkabacteria bacterium]